MLIACIFSPASCYTHQPWTCFLICTMESTIVAWSHISTKWTLIRKVRQKLWAFFSESCFSSMENAFYLQQMTNRTNTVCRAPCIMAPVLFLYRKALKWTEEDASPAILTSVSITAIWQGQESQKGNDKKNSAIVTFGLNPKVPHENILRYFELFSAIITVIYCRTLFCELCMRWSSRGSLRCCYLSKNSKCYYPCRRDKKK